MQIGACYIRVSTDDQLEFSPDAQKRAIFDYAKKNDIIMDENYVFVDEGISGRTAEKRPAFMEMIMTAKIKPQPFSVILVHKFDRFARSREDSVVYKAMLRKDCGVKVVSITEQLEDDKFSIILESMLEAMAEYYSLNLSEEVKKGMFEKARRGEHIGRSPFGYNIDKGKLIKNEYEFKIVQSIFDMYVNKNESLSFITKYLNENNTTSKYGGKWRVATVKYLLGNHVYSGLTRYNYRPNGVAINPEEDWIVADGDHEIAISQELFEGSQKKLELNSTLKWKTQKTSVIRSWCQHITVCNECGATLTINSCNNGKYRSFKCQSYSIGHCSISNSLSTKKLEIQVLAALQDDINNPNKADIQKTRTNDKTKELDILNENLKKLDEKFDLIKRSYLAKIDTIDEYKKNKEQLREEETKLLEKIKQSVDNINDTEVYSPIEFESYYKLLSNPDIDLPEKNKIAKQFIKEIRYNLKTDKIQVFYYH